MPATQLGKAERHVLGHDSADVAAAEHSPLVAGTSVMSAWTLRAWAATS